MSIRRIKKALGLLLVDIVIIIGIFVLQFRTDSNIIEKIGNLQITLAQDPNSQTESLILQNTLQLAYNGINISIDDSHPATATYIDSVSSKNQNAEAVEKTPVKLISYEKTNNSFEFTFTDNIKMMVALEDESQTSPLNIKVDLPENISGFQIPYSYSQTMTVQEEDKKHIVLDGKKVSWEFIVPGAEEGNIHFNSHDLVASYSIYDNTKQITFDNINELAIADEYAYQLTVERFKRNLISTFEASISDNSFSEQAVVSYIAAMAQNGNYTQAIDKIPQSFKKSSLRTYLSAPYLNNLESMNETLESTIDANLKQVAKYINSSSLDLYTVHNIATNLWLYPDVSTIRNMLIKASNSNISTASIDQVTGLLKTYLDLSSYKSGYAKYLEPILEECIQKILSSCTFERDRLTISENGTYLSVSQAVDAGTVLLRYGLTYGNDTLKMTGRALVNSYIGDSSSFDLRTLANIYPILAFDNIYYPHFQKIFTDNGTTAWAWTCATSVTYSSDTSSSCILTVEFPENWTHYVIVKGIPSFRTIYIYDMPFRTDPRFETYNSSGYVYKNSTDTLLLKSRHKAEKETVRLVFGREETHSEKAEVAQSPTTSEASNTSESETTETSDSSTNDELESFINATAE